MDGNGKDEGSGDSDSKGGGSVYDNNGADTGGGGGAFSGVGGGSDPGGSGVVVLKVPVVAVNVTGTYTVLNSGGFYYYQFTAGSGTITF